MQQEHKTKQELRDAARKLFAERGYSAVAIKDIASAIGKQPGGVYNHYDSKQAILLDLMTDNLDRAFEAVITPIDPSLPARQQLESFVRAHVRYNIDNPDDIFIAYMELRHLENGSAEIVLPKRDKFEGALRKILKEGVATDGFKLNDVSLHTRAILSMLVGVSGWYRPKGAKKPKEIEEFYKQAALQSVGVID
jgi:AcrR family transcriptional regulator